MSATFEAGKSYFTRSICDYDCIHTMHVVSRTAKTLRVKLHSGKTVKTLRVSAWNGVEQVKPFGNYSMCAIITAEKRVA